MDVKGYEGLYQVSSFGRVKSLGRVIMVEQSRYEKPRIVKWKPRVLKPSISKKGRNRRGCYAKVVLTKNGVKKNYEVHRLVAIAFIENPHKKPVVNHIDSNSMNNHIHNLEWCTTLENNIHCIQAGRKPNTNNSFFNLRDREILNSLFDEGIGVTAIAYQLELPYSSVRYVYRLRNKPANA